MSIEKKREFIINVCYYGIVFLMVYFGFKYAMSWLFPFIVAFFIVAIIQSVIKPIKKILKTKNEKVAIIVLLIVYGLIGIGLAFAFIKVGIIVSDLIGNLPNLISKYVEPTVTTLFNQLENSFINMHPSFIEILETLESNFMDIVMSLATSLSKSSLPLISSFATSIPVFLIGLLITIISSFFIATDYHHINEFIMAQCSPKVKNLIYDIKDYTVNTLFKIIFAYAKIMSITFVELSIGFIILGIDSPFLVALLISIFDVLPVLGTGGIMVPWVLYLLINGQINLAIGLLILYIIVTVIRNIIEPKIVGDQIGVHPLLMLIGMYAGVKIFGMFGLILFPVVLIIIKNLNDSEKIHLYKNIEKPQE